MHNSDLTAAKKERTMITILQRVMWTATFSIGRIVGDDGGGGGGVFCALNVLRNDTVSVWVCVTLLLAVIATESNLMVEVLHTTDVYSTKNCLLFFFDFLEIDVHQSHRAALFSSDAIEHGQKQLMIDQNRGKIKRSIANGQSTV